MCIKLQISVDESSETELKQNHCGCGTKSANSIIFKSSVEQWETDG